MAELIEDLQRVRQVADVFGVPSTAKSMRDVAQRALEHDEEEVRVLASRLLAELERARRPITVLSDSGRNGRTFGNRAD